MKVLRSSFAALLALAALVLWSDTGHAQFAPGDCVVSKTGGKPAVILGPSNVEGQVMARDLRLNSGSGQSFSPDQLKPIECPGAPVAQNACFQSDEGRGQSQLEQVVRQALVASLQQSQTSTAVALDAVTMGTVRAWTSEDLDEFRDGDSSQGIVDVKAHYRTCQDLTTDIYVTEQENNFACFEASAGGEVICEIGGATPDLMQPTSKTLPKD